MSFFRTIFVNCLLAYALGWLRYFMPIVPRKTDPQYYQDRLDLIRALLSLLKQMGDAYYNKGFCYLFDELGIPLYHRFHKIGTLGREFPHELWPTLSKHISYTINKYRKIGRFGVMVSIHGPVGMNSPLYPGMTIAEFALLNTDYGFACDVFLHEAYHDVRVGAKGCLYPASHQSTLHHVSGAFSQYVNWLRSYVDDSGNSLWTKALLASGCDSN